MKLFFINRDLLTMELCFRESYRMNIQTVSISKINPAPYNPRVDLKPTDPEYKAIVESLDVYGCVQPLV